MAKQILLSAGASKGGREATFEFDPSNEDAIYILRWVDNEDGEQHESFGHLSEEEVDGQTGIVFEEEHAYSYPLEHAGWNELTPEGYRSGEGEDQVWVGEVKDGAFKKEENIISIVGPLTPAQIQGRRDDVTMPPPPRRRILRVRRRYGAQKGMPLERPAPWQRGEGNLGGPGGLSKSDIGGRDATTDELERMTRGLQNLTLKRRRTGGRRRRGKKRKRRTRRKGRRRRTRRRRKRRH